MLFWHIISLFIFSGRIKMLSPLFLTFGKSGIDCECDTANWQKDLISSEFSNHPLSKSPIKPVTLMKTDVFNKCTAKLQPARFSNSCHWHVWKSGASIEANSVLLYNDFCSWTAPILLRQVTLRVQFTKCWSDNNEVIWTFIVEQGETMYLLMSRKTLHLLRHQ